MSEDLEQGTDVTRETEAAYYVFEEGFRMPDKVATLKEARQLKKQIAAGGGRSWILQRRVEKTTIIIVQSIG